jgi:carboxypeptidase family protein/TonB-dependent receptor-like protein
MSAFRARHFPFSALCFRAIFILTFFILTFFFQVIPTFAQSELATVFGRVTDQSGAVIAGAEIEIRSVDTGISVKSATNGDGLYTVPSLHPGHYVISVGKQGFRTVSATGLELNVQDNVARNFSLQVGSASESVTVTAEQTNINTTDATVSTVVDRNFAENLPLNGRSFQTLIQLTPGVVAVSSNAGDSGQFSVNGQRAASNYWMVDGVSANVGIGITSIGTPGNGLGGTLASFSAMGGTNSLVSVDALQEFRIQTSTYAPEFGRTPGGQVSIVTRSGTNQVHGTLFDYLRNDVLDANNWFNTAVSPALPKAKERQNDFGGTFNGPLWKDHTFFFFSYEGLRLRLPETELTTVPDLTSRENALPSMQPFLNAFPLPNGPDDRTTNVAQFNTSFSNPATLDDYSLRVDHRLKDNLNVFGRYNFSPSEVIQRGVTLRNMPLNGLSTTQITIHTATLGANWMMSSSMGDDLRLNYSRTQAFGRNNIDDFGGAVPLTSLPFPSPFNAENGQFSFFISSLRQGNLLDGTSLRNLQNQINFVNSLYRQQGSHSLKFGVDLQRLTPTYAPSAYTQGVRFATVSRAMNGQLSSSDVATGVGATFVISNLGVYAQDTWRMTPRITMTYGLRWDLNLPPSTKKGPNLAAAQNVDLSNLSSVALAPADTPPYSATYSNVAPRIGIAYQVVPKPDWGLVLRGGFGVFYDLATSEMGNLISDGQYPFGSLVFNGSGTFPLSASLAAAPPIMPPGGGAGTLAAFDPHLQLPYTLEWNTALEQGLGNQQTMSVSYIGAAGRRLLQTAESLSPAFFLQLVTNGSTSDYNALQLQFERRLSRSLQALASYTWSHSIDTASAGSFFNLSNFLVPGANPGFNNNRGSSDFDIRHGASAGLTYDIPSPKLRVLTAALLRGWAIDTFIQARSAPPVDVSDFNFFQLNNGILLNVRPDLIPGQPLYLFGSQYPGGKAFNPAAFQDPPGDFSTGIPDRQGNLGRNTLRGFGAFQWDFAVHRDFRIERSLKLQFRAEMFNFLNHPNFGQPSGLFGLGGFGLARETLGQSLNGSNLGGGAFNPLYQIGGPRSMQFALKFIF